MRGSLREKRIVPVVLWGFLKAEKSSARGIFFEPRHRERQIEIKRAKNGRTFFMVFKGGASFIGAGIFESWQLLP